MQLVVVGNVVVYVMLMVDFVGCQEFDGGVECIVDGQVEIGGDVLVDMWCFLGWWGGVVVNWCILGDQFFGLKYLVKFV